MILRLLAAVLFVLNFSFPVTAKALTGGETQPHVAEVMGTHLHQTSASLDHHQDGKGKMIKLSLVYDCAADNCQIANLALDAVSMSRLYGAASVILMNDALRASADHDLHRPPKV